MDLIDLTCRMFCEPKLIVDLEALTTFRDDTIAANEALIAAAGVCRKVLSSNQQFAEYIREAWARASHQEVPYYWQETSLHSANLRRLTEHRAARCTRSSSTYGTHARAVKSRIAETRAQRFIDATHADGTISVPLRYYAAHTGRFGGTEKFIHAKHAAQL